MKGVHPYPADVISIGSMYWTMTQHSLQGIAVKTYAKQTPRTLSRDDTAYRQYVPEKQGVNQLNFECPDGGKALWGTAIG